MNIKKLLLTTICTAFILCNFAYSKSKEKLSLNFEDVDVKIVLKAIADFTGLNIVVSDSVGGNLTLQLKNVPWDKALQTVLKAKNLGMTRTDNIIVVVPRSELINHERNIAESNSQNDRIIPLTTKAFALNYHKAHEVGNILNSSKSTLLSNRGTFIVDSRTNQIIVKDLPKNIESIATLIKTVDIEVKQVLIEARIVEANNNFGRSLGVKLGYHDNEKSSKQNRVSGNLAGVADLSGQSNNGVGKKTDIANTNFISLPAASINGASASSFAVSLFNAAATKFINLELSALEYEGQGKIVSSPRIITADQIKAVIEQGTELPYSTETSSGGTALAFRKANLRLEVTPQITPNQSILMDVDVSKDSVGIETANGFSINTKHITTQVLVGNGGTVVIGGIYQQDQSEAVSKVPLLGDIPFIGALFRSKIKKNNKTELLIFLTPRLVKNGKILTNNNSINLDIK